MNRRDPIRVLLADDHPVVRAGLAAILATEPDLSVIAEAGTGGEAVELHRRHRPELTLMDLRMPEIGGVEATRAICREFPAARIIVLTTYDGDEDIHRALQAGARGYLLKHMLRRELVAAVRAVQGGQRYIPAEVATRLAERDEGSTLTPREIEVLRLVSRGLTNDEIGGVLGIGGGTISTHLRSILRKLEASDRTEAVTIALQRGVIHLGD
jgi:two-component system NarL family response regulator